MHEPIRVKYRFWHQGKPPKPIRLQIPGWSGDDHQHSSGSKAQPWHCQPFVDGSTYGLELCYPFDTECHVQMKGGRLEFVGDFEEENKITMLQNVKLPPFSSFADGHFGMTSCLDLQVPDDMVLRMESHPRFYTDTTNTVPCVVPGHLQTSWWTKIFFVVFKNPAEGQKYIFRRGEPYAQIFVLPKKCSYDVVEMTENEKFKRGSQDKIIVDFARNIAGNTWVSDAGHEFDDKYKKLSTVAAKSGCPHVTKHLEDIKNKPKVSIKRRLLKRGKNEDATIQDKQKDA